MSKLAIYGGVPIRQGLLPAQITVDEEERKAAEEVLKRKLLSGFRGNSSQAFYGGDNVKNFETLFNAYLNQEPNSYQAISVNSCTSALQLACGAIGLGPGDEVIVTPWSMSCSASAPLIYGAVPVFADIEYDYFCLDPKSVESKITPKTKAIIAVDLFGQPFNPEILNIAEKYNLDIIEDAAQAIGSYWRNIPAGYIGDIGCFSFTQGKHLTAGEGGMAVSRNSKYIRNLQLLRNHAEAVISDMNNDMFENEKNMVGFNMRMTEIQAAILIEQLKKLDSFVKRRQENAAYFNSQLKEIPAIKPVPVRLGCTHSYYVQAFYWDQEIGGIHRDKFIQAVKAELQPQEGRIDLGVPISCGYVRPLYMAPLYQKKMHWTIKDKNYQSVVCHNAEKLWIDELFLWTLNGLDLNDKDRKDISDAFFKVWSNKEELR